MLTRRDLVKAGGLLALAPAACTPLARSRRELVNDIHSELNPTWVDEVVRPRTLAELEATVRDAARRRGAISICGGRHAMGGQQFGTDTTLVDCRGLDRVLGFDRERGLLEVEAGIAWPALVSNYLELQAGAATAWGIAQKQTGADRLTVGGTLSCNGHGRGLRLAPFVADVAAIRLIDARGELVEASRERNAELFRLVAGGYGLFGILYSLTLRLTPRRKLERVVELIEVPELMAAVERRLGEGFLYGDFQFAIDPGSADFLHRGVFSCYRPVADSTAMPAAQRELADRDWLDLLYLAHADKRAAFERYARYYQSTSGQLYWSDTHQLGPYFDGYHRGLDRRLARRIPGSEVITELYVPRPQLAGFLAEVAAALRAHGDEIIYGTVRLIERDEDSFLPWAREAYACTVMNLHVDHSETGRRRAGDAFRRLIDLALRRGGSFYLTYHRHATRAQIETAYPRMAEFLARKREHDPRQLFQSDWYRHLQALFA